MIWYPMSTGRSVAEILRLVRALQTSDKETASTPEGWQPGDDLLEPAPLTLEASVHQEPGGETPDWYYRLRKS
jgi:peroxiredoxin (alkyl hydroperoxide reductase subunit C)